MTAVPAGVVLGAVMKGEKNALEPGNAKAGSDARDHSNSDV